MLRRQLPWVAVLVTLATAVLVLFGPLWSTAEGENPMARPRGPDWTAILGLSLPTVMVLAAAAVALLGPRRPLLSAVGLAVFVVALVKAPDPVPGWFVPALVLTAAAWVWGVVGARGERRSARV